MRNTLSSTKLRSVTSNTAIVQQWYRKVKLKHSLKIDKSIEIGYLFYLVVIKIKFKQRSIMFKIFNDADQVLTKT